MGQHMNTEVIGDALCDITRAITNLCKIGGTNNAITAAAVAQDLADLVRIRDHVALVLGAIHETQDIAA